MRVSISSSFAIIFAAFLCGALVLGATTVDLTPFSTAEKTVEPIAIPPEALKAEYDTEPPTLYQKILSILPISPQSDRARVPLVASMIENHEDARPHQFGLKDAEIVFEMIVEGDISRFLAVFRADRLPEVIGPVRSLRPHFISAIEHYTPLLLHIGGSQRAYDQLTATPGLINHDGIRYDGETFERYSGALPPHNLIMKRDPLLDLLESLGSKLTLVNFPLYDINSAVPEGGTGAQIVELFFGGPIHDVTYTYDETQRHYVRSVYNADEQGTPENILVLQTTIEGYNQPGYIPWTQTFGGGQGILFRNGRKYDVSWSREKDGRFIFSDTKGNPLTFAKGQIWITLFPSLTQVEWR